MQVSPCQAIKKQRRMARAFLILVCALYALISVMSVFFIIWLVSTLDKSESGKQEQMDFDKQYADAFKT